MPRSDPSALDSSAALEETQTPRQGARAPAKAGEPSQAPQSKIHEGKRPRTPAQIAASIVNLQKARTAMQQQGYKRTPKRDAANLRNLAKAHEARLAERARLAADLDEAFPLREGEEDPEGAEVLEKVGRTILRRWHSMQWGIKRERREVMGLLRRAAGRVVPASRGELVELATDLMMVFFVDGLLRWEIWRRRIKKQLAELQYGRYLWLPGLLNLVVAARLGLSLEEMRARRRAEREECRARGPEEEEPEEEDTEEARDLAGEANGPTAAAPAPPGPRPVADGTAPRPATEGTGPCPLPDGRPDAPRPRPSKRRKFEGPNLPRKFEDFQALVDRAFCAPAPAPAKGEVRRLLDQLGRALWQRLHLFEERMTREKRELAEALEEMGEEELEVREDVEERREQIVRLLKEGEVEEQTKTLYLECRCRLQRLLTLRFGRCPGIERFLKWTDPENPHDLSELALEEL